MIDDCLFCKIIRREIPAQVIAEDEATFAFMDIHPVNPGHILVVPKAHSVNILDTSRAALHAVMDTVQRIAPAVLAAVGAEGFNLGVNNGAAAGQMVSHFHLHIMPRFAGDGHALWHGKEMTAAELEGLADKIKKQLT